MDGHETFQVAVKRLSEATIAAVARAGLELDDVDLFVYHQANGRILRAVGERLDLPPARVVDYVADVGNTSAASIPLALSLRARTGACAPATGPDRRDRRRLHLGRRHARVGNRLMARPDNASALVTGGSRGIGAAIAARSPPTAGRSA